MVFFPYAEMFLRFALVTIFALPVLISGSQIPVINGVIGGVSSGDAHNSSYKTLARSGSSDPSACTPGNLRGVVENSCICGEVPLFNTHNLSCSVLAEEKGVYQASGYGDLAPDKSVWSVSNSGVLSVFLFFICVPPTGSGSLPRVMTPTRLPSLRGSMAA